MSLFLGINDATEGEWLFGLGVLVVIIVILGILVYYTVCYIVEIIRKVLKRRSV